MRALVTGGAGFIGSHTADRLLREGWDVTTLDNFDDYYDPSQKRRNVRFASESARYRLLEGDIRDGDALGRSLDPKPDVVVHIAARPGVRASLREPSVYVEVNELGGLRVLEACRERSIPLVLASTSSVYGASATPPFREDDPAVCPLSPYAATKRAAELMAYAMHSLYGLPIAILRFFTVYGPRGRPDMAVWRFTDALRSGATLRLHGEATARDFTYVDDIVDGVLGAVSWLGKGGRFDTFNLGRSEPIVVRRAIEILAAALGVEAKIHLAELEPGESPTTAADTSRARAAFGYEPKISFEEGVRRWIEWRTTSPESPEGAP